MGIKKNISLVQLASEDRIVLIHLALFPEVKPTCPPTLKEVLEDPGVTKIGVAIKADCTRFRRFFDVQAKSIFELSHLYKLIKYSELKDYMSINKRLVPLAQQVEEHLKLPMFKGSDIRKSDWSRPVNLEQLYYAASDAYASLQLFETMDVKRKALDPPPPRPYNIDENKAIRLAADVVVELEEESSDEDAATITSPRFKANSKTTSLNLDPDFQLLVNGFADIIMDQPVETTNGAAKTTDEGIDSVDKIAINTPPRTTRMKAPAPSKSPVVLAADDKAIAYREAHPNTQATIPYLRAYFMWRDNPGLPVGEIASLLRKEPLTEATVSQYILQAITLERLFYDKERIAELMQHRFLKQRYLHMLSGARVTEKNRTAPCGLTRQEAGRSFDQ